MKHRDADAVWLGILRQEPSLVGKTRAEIRRVLVTDGGFPDRLIRAYLASRFPRRKRATESPVRARLRDMVATDGTQVCLARRLGVSPQYLSAVLAGKKGLGNKIPPLRWPA